MAVADVPGEAGALDDEASRPTASRLNGPGYVQELDRLHNKKNTILARLEELTEMAKVLSPRRDWNFIRRTAARVRARRADPSLKRARMAGTEELFALGLQLMDCAPQQKTPLRSAVLYRDGLIIAFLALRCLRRRNLSELTIGGDLRRTGEGWTILLPPSATKTHATLEYDWPVDLSSTLIST